MVQADDPVRIGHDSRRDSFAAGRDTCDALKPLGEPAESNARFIVSSEAKKRYLQLVRSVDAILKAHDPLDLLKSGAPSDEYEGEARAIVSRLAHCKDGKACRDALANVFEESFGLNNKSAEVYALMAREILALRNM